MPNLNTQRFLRADLLAIIASVLLACTFLQVRGLRGYTHWSIILLARVTIAFIVMTGIARLRGIRLSFSRNRLVWLMMGLACMGISGNIYAVSILPPAEVLVFGMASPIWVALALIVFFKKYISFSTWFALGFGFSGMIVFSQPHFNSDKVSMFVALWVGICFGIAVLIISRIRGVRSNVIICHTLGALVIFSTGLVTYFYFQKELYFQFTDWKILLMFPGIGLCAAFASLFRIRATQLGNVPLISSLSYICIPVTAAFSFIFWQEYPSILSMLGMVMIILSALWVVFNPAKTRPIVLIDMLLDQDNALSAPEDFYAPEVRKSVEQTVEKAERKTSCEMRVHLEIQRKFHIAQPPENIFLRLGMDKTRFGNGILVFVRFRPQKIIILSDSRIEDRLNKNDIRKLVEKFSTEKTCLTVDYLKFFIEGLGEHLQHFYPVRDCFEDEISNKVSIGLEPIVVAEISIVHTANHTSPKVLFDANARKNIENTIENAENKTSCEIRVHIDSPGKSHKESSPENVFHNLGIDLTRFGNGILVFVQFKPSKIIVLSDPRIQECISNSDIDNFRRRISKTKPRLPAEYLTLLIEELGETMQTFYPVTDCYDDELPNTVSF